MGTPQIFISYASPDKIAAVEVCEVLESVGLLCWIAPRNIRPGKNFGEEIVLAIRDCRILVLLLSPSANKSPHVLQEVDRAFSQGREILILRVEDVEARGALEYYLSGKQWLDAFSLPLKPHLGRLCERAWEILELSPPPAAPPTPKPVPLPQTFALEKPARGFCLPWSSWDQAPTRIRNAAVLITDHGSLTLSDVSKFAKQCRKAGKTLAVVAPTLEASVIKFVKSVGGLVIEAKALHGQPMGDLLEDLAAYLGGGAFLREFGFGLLQPPEPEDKVNGVVRRFMQVADLSVDDLGKALEVWPDTNSICFEAEQTGPGMDWQIKALKHRATHCARSHDELNGLLERLRRFGVVESMAETTAKPVAFRATRDEIILPAGFASPYFISDSDFRCTLNEPKVLVTTIPLHDAEVVIPALELAEAEWKSHKNRLVVFAPRIEEEARALLVTNKLRGIVVTLGVEISALEQLTAIALLSGAQLIDQAGADRLSRASARGLVSADGFLGTVRKVVAEYHKTRILR
jgi:hypothetical protein